MSFCCLIFLYIDVVVCKIRLNYAMRRGRARALNLNKSTSTGSLLNLITREVEIKNKKSRDHWQKRDSWYHGRPNSLTIITRWSLQWVSVVGAFIFRFVELA
jgi:hypothetical protein